MDAKNWTVFAVGGALGASLAVLYLARTNKKDTHKESEGRGNFGGDDGECSADNMEDTKMANFMQDEILAEQLTRNVQFFGEEGQVKIAKSFVVVVGLGGVGSHLAHLLLRSGVGRLRIVDFDMVTLSSLNRHAVATREDVGIPKATCLTKHFKNIVPEAVVESLVVMYNEDTKDAVLAGEPDFVIDAIDNIETKVGLLAACKSRNIPVLCMAGAGAKADPTRLRFADISESSIDPLARAVRHKLRRDHGIDRGVPVLLSTEKPRCQLVSLGAVESGNPLDYQIVPNFRVRTIPVLGTSPSLFGIAAASYVLCEIAEMPFTSEPLFKMQSCQYDIQHTRLVEREELKFGEASGVLVDLEEVRILVREVWRGMSARSMGLAGNSKDKGLNRNTDQLVLTRWDASKPAGADNLILLTFDEAEQHENTTLNQLRKIDSQFCRFVEATLEKCHAQFFT